MLHVHGSAILGQFSYEILDMCFDAVQVGYLSPGEAWPNEGLWLILASGIE
jgi:hypothetical protein